MCRISRGPLQTIYDTVVASASLRLYPAAAAVMMQISCHAIEKVNEVNS